VHLGFRAADLVGSTGLRGELQLLLRRRDDAPGPREALRGGAPANDNVAEVSGVTRWTSERLAAEIASLYHLQGARVFTVMDDNLLPLAPEEAEAFLRRLAHELRQNRVGPIALSLQLRADVVTPAVADALVAVA
jgi:hypothetical protein